MSPIRALATGLLALSAVSSFAAPPTAIGKSEGQLNIIAWAGYIERGETVKALVVLSDAQRGQVSEADIVDWAHTQMAAYKSPRIVQFVDSLPKSGTGKVQWRELQEREKNGAAAAP